MSWREFRPFQRKNPCTCRRLQRIYFTKVYGSTTAKADALYAIRAVHRDSPIVFFGDAVGDWEAAQTAAVAFIAVVNERDNFGDQPVIKLWSFADLAEVEACLGRALQNGNMSDDTHNDENRAAARQQAARPC